MDAIAVTQRGILFSMKLTRVRTKITRQMMSCALISNLLFFPVSLRWFERGRKEILQAEVAELYVLLMVRNGLLKVENAINVPDCDS